MAKARDVVLANLEAGYIVAYDAAATSEAAVLEEVGRPLTKLLVHKASPGESSTSLA